MLLRSGSISMKLPRMSLRDPKYPEYLIVSARIKRKLLVSMLPPLNLQIKMGIVLMFARNGSKTSILSKVSTSQFL
jgi:hypothetical protein